MNCLSEKFAKLGEYYAAGLYEEPDQPLFIRYARALRRYFENCHLNPYNGEPLYPYGAISDGLHICPSFASTITVHWDIVREKYPDLFDTLWEDISAYQSLVPKEHEIGGNMYTHSYPNFRRIIREGLDSYEERIQKIEDDSIRLGLLDLCKGIRVYHARILSMLKESAKDTALYKALLNVPFKPAQTLYEALVSWNFVYYLDGCDDIGQLDADLIDFYKGEDIIEILQCLFRNADANGGWSGTLGPNYNPLTLQCLKAIKGFRRPSLELRVTPNMPDEYWNAAMEAIQAGGGSPSLYNEEGYQTALQRLFPEMPKEDRLRFAGGGCTETMIAGLSNVGSIDAGINVALIFEHVMRTVLPTAASFEEFYSAFLSEYKIETLSVLNAVRDSQKLRAKYRPDPMRTLLIDDCIENGKDFNNGGTRYSWSIVNLAGMINVLDSLLVIDHLVFKNKTLSGKALLAQLDAGETFLGYVDIPRHATDNETANAMARRLSSDLTEPFSEITPYLGGIFMPAAIQNSTYVDAGKNVGATPDGRISGSPLCDSIGAIHKNDKLGITALLNSASALCQQNLCGTPVLNVKLDAAQMHESFKPLVLGYFHNGGLQMQITCVRKEDLLEAQNHPEKYPNLIIRIGGYSEYFTRLSPELQQTVIDRTEYGV